MQNKPGFGLINDDEDLSAVGQSDAVRLRSLIASHGVVVFRHQMLDDDGFVSFLQSLGEMTFTPGETPLPDHPILNAVTNRGRQTPPRSVFHTDSSYMQKPPAYTGLRAVVVPRSGGATLFSDQYDAAERLPERWRTALAAYSVRHSVTGLEGQTASCWHPLLRRHPITKRTALYLSTPERCDQIAGLNIDDSRHLIALLYQRSITPSRLFKHEWQTGDVVVWDNRCTMHRADHSDTVGDRVLHRGLVKGEAPVRAQSDNRPPLDNRPINQQL